MWTTSTLALLRSFAPLSVDIDEEIEEVNDYRSEDIDSPASTYTTTDSSCMPSPPNLTLDEDGQLSNWFDFFPSGLIDGTTLGGFSLLTLSDEEQRQLYKAALVIQNAFRQYKGRQQQKQQELEAAVIIQSYYRRYKDYVGYLQMSQAARVIQNRFRSYKNYRQFQKSRKAAIIIQSRFRSYRANKQFRKSRNAAILIQQRFRDKRMARLKREQDAARKIQRFIRHYQNRSVNNMSNLTSAIEQVSQQYE
ncbi:putative calmodulin-binding transcription activator 1 [Apostichopus japonicus]|uniref:Putative calmodulin-binding transcription activator 1 n=1 Tax=Stichopus japonicus TaxID=307972 RepID=A0A2G8LDM9_STIJA|nr:putative calmodulin-binding transcription activator 1 [Apostichopus japonicus]